MEIDLAKIITGAQNIFGIFLLLVIAYVYYLKKHNG